MCCRTFVKSQIEGAWRGDSLKVSYRRLYDRRCIIHAQHHILRRSNKIRHDEIYTSVFRYVVYLYYIRRKFVWVDGHRGFFFYIVNRGVNKIYKCFFFFVTFL